MPVKSTGEFRVDGSAVRGNGNVFEGNVTVGSDSGPGVKVGGSVSGPISKTLKYVASGSLFDTKGYIRNVYLNENADPFRDVSGRVRLV